MTLLPGQVAAAPGPVDQSVTYAVNHGLRRDASRLAAAVATTEPDDTRRWRRLADRWAWFVAVLRMQSAGQEDGVWPLLRRRCDADEARLLDALVHEHDSLLSACGVVSGLLERLAAGQEPGAAHAAAVVRASSVRDALLHHLAHEEADAMPVLQRWMTPAEWRAVDREFYLGRMSPGFVLRLVPWVAHGLPPDRLEQVLRAAGPQFRLLLRLVRGRFERHEGRLLGGG